MKLLPTLAALLGTASAAAIPAPNTDKKNLCMKCEYVGAADSEAAALAMLEADPATLFGLIGGSTGLLAAGVNYGSAAAASAQINDLVQPCLGGASSAAWEEAVQSGDVTFEGEDGDKHCVATFFLFHAVDIKKYIYGVTRTVSSSAVSGTVVDISHYEGVKGWSQSVSQKDIWANTDTNRETEASGFYNIKSAAVEGEVLAESGQDTGVSLTRVFAQGENYGVNLRFVQRGFNKFKFAATQSGTKLIPVRDTATDSTYQTFMMDGRESQPTDVTDRQSNKSPTTTAIQQRDNVLCLVCHGAAEFTSLPTSTLAIGNKIPCWNAAGSAKYMTDDVSAADVNKYCSPVNGMCETNTYQYSTKSGDIVTSYWVGITRGCQSTTETSVTNDKVGMKNTATKRNVGTIEQYRRLYAATTSAAKAKANAKYPDAGTNTGSAVKRVPYSFGNGVLNNELQYADAGDLFGLTGTDSGADLQKVHLLYKTYGYISYMPAFDGTGSAATPKQTWARDSNLYYSTATAYDSAISFNTVGSTPTICTADGSPATFSEKCAYPVIQPLTISFQSSDGAGAPDLPKPVAAVDEIECISCVTPLSNTNADNVCVTAKSTDTVKCKTMSCLAQVANFKLSSTDTDVYYYAKRGCDADPDKTLDTNQASADAHILPAGYTGVGQTNQQSAALGNKIIANSAPSVASVFTCYNCETIMTKTVAGAAPSEPTFDEIRAQDVSNCWQVFPPSSSGTATVTTSKCEGKCFVTGYRYSEANGDTTNPMTTFNWKVTRGCDDSDSVVAGNAAVPGINGISSRTTLCDYRNGTLCNGKIENYETDKELKNQVATKLQCYTCDSPAGNGDPEDACYTLPSTAKAVSCPDLSYTSCFATATAYNTSATTSIYVMNRGCSKETVAGVTTSTVEGFTNVQSTTTTCLDASCNKAVGAKGDLALGVTSSGSTGGDSTATDDVAEADATEPEDDSGSTALFASVSLLLISYLVQ